MARSRKWSLVLGIALLGLSACAGFEPMELPNNADLKPGPGLITGPSGELVLYGAKASPPAGEASKEP
jgi:hypothetical protein